ncbi:hypothetical protein D3C75_1105360 [compost metagenome]
MLPGHVLRPSGGDALTLVFVALAAMLFLNETLGLQRFYRRRVGAGGCMVWPDHTPPRDRETTRARKRKQRDLKRGLRLSAFDLIQLSAAPLKVVQVAQTNPAPTITH